MIGEVSKSVLTCPVNAFPADGLATLREVAASVPRRSPHFHVQVPFTLNGILCRFLSGPNGEERIVSLGKRPVRVFDLGGMEVFDYPRFRTPMDRAGQ